MNREAIEIRGVNVQNLKNVDIDIPLGEFVGVAGVSYSLTMTLTLSAMPTTFLTWVREVAKMAAESLPPALLRR